MSPRVTSLLPLQILNCIQCRTACEINQKSFICEETKFISCHNECHSVFYQGDKFSESVLDIDVHELFLYLSHFLYNISVKYIMGLTFVWKTLYISARVMADK